MKLKPLLIILSFSCSAFVFAETVYKTRDAEGNAVFSDVPSEGAEEVIIKEPQSINIPMPQRSGNRQTIRLSPEEINYTRFNISSPENDATIHSNEGKVNVSVDIDPALDEKHTIVFLMNGKKVSTGKSLQLALQDIDRGTHTVTALVQNEQEKVVKRAEQLTFHLRKDSVLFKNRTKNNVGNEAGPAPAAPVIPAL